MNDDFLRRARRPPPAAFANQLKERLRQQDVEETSRRRPSWRLLAIPLLVAGTALATATYLTMSHVPWLSSSATQATQPHNDAASRAQSSARQGVASGTNAPNLTTGPQTWEQPPSTPLAQQETPTGGARDNGHSSGDASSGGVAGASGSMSATRSGTLTPPLIRILVTPDLAAITKETSPRANYLPPVSFELDTADMALRALCTGAPANRPDIVIAPRRIRQEELAPCNEHGVDGLLETKLGHVAVVVTRAKTGSPMQLSADTLLLALLKRVPSPDDPSRLIDNPYTHWNQIDPALEDRRIEVLGPAGDSPEFIVLAATLLEPACDKYSSIRALQYTDRSAYEQICHNLRDDGAYSEARFDGTFVGQRLWSDPGVVAIMDYRFYAAHSADLLGSLLTGASPTRESIMDGSYVGARTLYFYITRLRYERIPTVRLFVNEYLRLQAFTRHGVVIPPDGNTDSWRPSRAAQLTEVKLD